MDCGTPFCQIGMEIRGGVSGCPIYNLIPEWNDLVYRGRWKEALERLQKTNNFLNLLEEYVQHLVKAHVPSRSMIQQYRLKISNGRSLIKVLKNGWITPRIPSSRTGKKVAIVGSGPAGLASADQLNQAGHAVTVFERSDRLVDCSLMVFRI